ncbi:MAG: P1 family peptidase [Candidatus Promineifilaceae bacterium]
MPRIRELDIFESVLLPGPLNAITDVSGVAVGHYTLNQGTGESLATAFDEGLATSFDEWQPGNGPFRTGVTVVLPHLGNLYEEKVPAAVHTINGFGKVAGFEQVRELGNIETPIALTGTLNVPRVADALMTLAIEQSPHIGIGFAESGRQGWSSVNPVVGETSDGYLSDIHARPIGLAEVRAAVENASTGPVAEGAVGAGTGTSCYGWKGGIGTASRVLPAERGGFTVGALVQSNFGRPDELTIAGVPIGRYLLPPVVPVRSPAGSIMMVLATDAPLDARQLGRLAHRAAFGLARTGSTVHGGSGDFVIAFSTAYRILDRPDGLVTQRPALAHEQLIIGALGLAVIETVEEAVYNSLLMARTIVGRDGNTRYALSAGEVQSVVRQHKMS